MNIGTLGLGVMGRSLALNFARNGYSVAGYDVHIKFEVSLFKDKSITIFDTLDGLVAALEKLRVLLMMIPAGKPVDKAIVSITSLLDKGDIIINGGNSFFMNTDRRTRYIAEDGIRLVGMGRGGAGHYIKMVHKGIVYGDMQLIAEVYDLLHRGAGISNDELADIFAT